ncbi:1,4-alpha-glucan-branching enzyme [Candidatus Saccharibacteria bacterium]|jgi:1,4-alpha-glucan branching enzyme|nr:1,4-alpha-glucan-branching enzyme [Candidatus Saccharibacteria bacterium]
MVSKKTLLDYDEWLQPFADNIRLQKSHIKATRKRILGDKTPYEFSLGWHHFGLHPTDEGWVLREWAPNATDIYLVCEKNRWSEDPSYAFSLKSDGQWELRLPKNTLRHGDHYKLLIYWNGGRSKGFRIPAYANYVVQDEKTHGFDAVVYHPKKSYEWKNRRPIKPAVPLIYEAHVGMASTEEKVASYKEFTKNVLPRIKELGYNTVQLMAVAEHPYYGSFGYHVANFYAPSSRFGTPDELRELVDTAHGLGLRVIMDIVHSHSVKNEEEGLGNFAGDPAQYFHAGERGNHSQWDSRTFDYGKPQVAHFLLSNVRYWLDEFRFDGYRFDGVTSMLYSHHGLGKSFVKYDDYFGNEVELDSLAYLQMANDVAHQALESSLTIAEDTSGMPGLALSTDKGGIGFDYRLSMGVPDLWIKTLKERKDEDWDLGHLFYELVASRPEEKVISYAESHDQALVGDKAIMFRLADKSMYWHMQADDKNVEIARAMSLHKMIRLLTASTHGGGYLNFMGNEFGHPEWIDFPRSGNNWSYQHARRRWDLADDGLLKYRFLQSFDQAMINIIKNLNGEFHYINIRQKDNLLSFVRDNYVFIFNFSPNNSYVDYSIPTFDGSYSLELNTDSPEFDGQGLVRADCSYFASEQEIQVYIPARSALVLLQH